MLSTTPCFGIASNTGVTDSTSYDSSTTLDSSVNEDLLALLELEEAVAVVSESILLLTEHEAFDNFSHRSPTSPRCPNSPNPVESDIRGYVKRLASFMRCPLVCLVGACPLIARVLEYTAQSEPVRWKWAQASISDTMKKIFLGCAVLMIKMHCDDYEVMHYYAYVGGVPPALLKQIELDLLTALKFDISVSRDDTLSVLLRQPVALPTRTLIEENNAKGTSKACRSRGPRIRSVSPPGMSSCEESSEE